MEYQVPEFRLEIFVDQVAQPKGQEHKNSFIPREESGKIRCGYKQGPPGSKLSEHSHMPL